MSAAGDISAQLARLVV
jgi:hypothetical protein